MSKTDGIYTCENCSSNFNEPYSKWVQPRFCCRKCANTYVSRNFANTPEKRKQKSQTLSKEKPQTLTKEKSQTLTKEKPQTLTKEKPQNYCKVCGFPKGECCYPHICKNQSVQRKSHNLVKLGFDFSVLGTPLVYQEWYKLRDRLYNNYHNLHLSIPDLMKKYDIPSERTFSILLPKLNISSRTLSDSQITYYSNIGTYDNKTEKEIYMLRCEFKFGFGETYIQGYDLVQQYGVYNPFINITGATRDHIFSKLDGWKNNVPSEIISSPANCVYMLQRDNSSKSSKSAITLEQLYERYKLWKNGCRNLPYVKTIYGCRLQSHSDKISFSLKQKIHN